MRKSLRPAHGVVLFPVFCSVIVAMGTASPAAMADESFLRPGSLIISSSAYDRSQGAVASLKVGTVLPNSATATTTAVSDNNYLTVWNNESVDASFGVTSPIRLTAVDPRTGHALHSIAVPTWEVVTSFSSKSELGLHIARDRHGAHLVFVGYASPGVGALDASNSDAVAGQDPTNPVTFAFGDDYAFHRTIVSLNEDGRFSYTPTVNYGGNNGRAALLGSNGLYYTVGNSNNGNSAAFGASNGTSPDVTETTGLEVVKPINSWTAGVTIPADNSAEVDPLIQYPLGKNGGLDKPGKDNNYRGVTEFNGALYFTKGQWAATVWTPSTPSARCRPWRTRPPQTIKRRTGIPRPDSARSTGGDLPRPSRCFFGEREYDVCHRRRHFGASVDATTHGGLQK